MKDMVYPLFKKFAFYAFLMQLVFGFSYIVSGKERLGPISDQFIMAALWLSIAMGEVLNDKKRALIVQQDKFIDHLIQKIEGMTNEKAPTAIPTTV